MGGECYHYINLRHGCVISHAQSELYRNEVLPQLVETVNTWWDSTLPQEQHSLYAHVTASIAEGIRIETQDERFSWSTIVIPPMLDSTLRVGWQHRSYASYIDPKHDAAERLIKMMKDWKELLPLLKDEQEDNVLADLGVDQDLDSDDYSSPS